MKVANVEVSSVEMQYGLLGRKFPYNTLKQKIIWKVYSGAKDTIWRLKHYYKNIMR